MWTQLEAEYGRTDGRLEEKHLLGLRPKNGLRTIQDLLWFKSEFQMAVQDTGREWSSAELRKLLFDKVGEKHSRTVLAKEGQKVRKEKACEDEWIG